MIRLYDRRRSGNCYRVRLLLALLGLEYERVPINTAGGASIYHGSAALGVGDDPKQSRVDNPAEEGINRSHWFLSLNPRGQVPVLEDGEQVIWDSTAILVYLARKFGGESWLPADAAGEAQVVQWLALAQNELLYGLARCRGILEMGRPGNLAECQALGRAGLDVMEQRLQKHDWLALDRRTIGDVACFPSASLAPEVGVGFDDYPAIERWVRRMEALPGFTPLYDR
jgi:glutathione S-transferase